MDKKETIIIIGCFDTKAVDFKLLYNFLKEYKSTLITINVGINGSTDMFSVDYDADIVAEKANISLAELRKKADRGYALEKMGIGASKLVEEIQLLQDVQGVIGMGGGGGTYLFISAVKNIPLGIPKVCLSTLASKDMSDAIGSKDITLIPSIVDIAGLNFISRRMISQAAGAIVGMVRRPKHTLEGAKGNIALSIFGNTTVAANLCSRLLKEKSYDVLPFHAIGTGGKNMESLILENCFDAVLDLTTTELADFLCGGICSAGPDRLTAAGIMGIPQLVVPGCMDMVNFGPKETVPDKYKTRQLFSWGPDVTLMRTNKEENEKLGRAFAEKLNASTGPVAVLIPLKGLSKISSKGEVFYKPEVDAVLFNSIKEHLNPKIQLIEIDTDINSEPFAQQASASLISLLEKEELK